MYDNRIKDKEELEGLTDLNEHGQREIYFYTQKGTLIAEGYVRIVYGDHGPYTEFLREQIKWDQFTCEREGIGYYNKWYPKDGCRILLYEQRMHVRGLPNPPGGKRSYNGDRKEGYADYRIGRMYIDPYQMVCRHTRKI